MANEWDAAGNGIAEINNNPTQLFGEQIRRDWELEYRTRRLVQDRRYGNVNVPHMPDVLVRSSFPHWADATTGMYEGVVAPYHANRALWICHNCGTYGWKQGTIRELFKCYCCRSRNVTICRAGELSLAIRNLGLGVNMTTVYEQRRIRQREARSARRTARST